MGISLLQLPDIDIRKGTLEETPLSFLMGAAKIWKVTGVLTVERNKAHKEVFFLEGLPVYCRSELSGESLRQVMLKAGQIEQESLDKVEAFMEKENVEEDRALLELGILDESSRYFHLQEQSRKRLLTLFGSAQGCYIFEFTEDFLDRVELFDIDPLHLICEGTSTYHVLDAPSLLQEAAAETVETTDIMEETVSFVQRYFPEARLESIPQGETSLGQLLGELHPDISKSMELVFILLVSGAIVINGKMPGENNPPTEAEKKEEAIEEASEETAEEANPANPWEGKVEAPSLEDEDILDTETEASEGAERPPETESVKSANTSPKAKKPPKPPPEPPWKKKRKKIEKQPTRFKVTYGSKRTSTARKPEKTEKPRTYAEAAPKDPQLEERFRKMLEVIRRGDPFEILDVTPEASTSEVKKAYFYRHSQFNPDKSHSMSPGAKKTVDEVEKGLRNAYDTLLDPNKRFDYEMGLFADERKKAWSLQLMKQLAEKQWMRGKWYLSQRKPELALKFFDTAANLDTEQAPYYAFLGWTQYASRSNDAGASKSYIKTALGINPRYAEAYLFMGWITKDQGHEKDALECFQKAVEYDPKNVFAQQELEKLGGVKKSESKGFLDKLLKK